MQTTIGENSGWRQTQVTTAVTLFNVDFPFFSIDDLAVQVTVGDVTTRLMRGSDYDVGGTPGDDGVYPSGTVTIRYPLSSCLVTISRLTEIERNANFPLTGYFDRLSLNAQLNRLTVILQDFRRLGTAGLRVAPPDYGAAPNLVLPPLSLAPGMTLMFDSNGHPYYGTQVDLGGISASAFGLQLLQAANAAAADTLLGMSAYFQTLLGAANAAALRALIGVTDPASVGPVGTIHEYAGSVEPLPNFMFPDGRALSRTAYPTLFTNLGVAHGAGDGSTTFNIPDRRGRSGFAKDNMGGTAAGRLTVAHGGVDGLTLGAHGGLEARTLDLAHIPPHTHGGPAYTNVAQVGGIQPIAVDNQSGPQGGTSGGGQELAFMPPAYVNNYIIRVL